MPCPRRGGVPGGWRIAADSLKRCRQGLPHARITGDDEFGRPAHFRAWLRRERERHVLDGPGDTVVRDLECRRPRRGTGRGARRQGPFCRVDAWAARQPESRRARPTIRDGERGPLLGDAMTVRVRAKLDRRNGPEERLVVMRAVEAEPETHYARSNAGPGVTLEELARVRFARHKVGEVFEAAEQEAGLAHHEVRGWVGWHRHVTLSLLASWSLCRERRRVGGETPAMTVSQVREAFARLLRVPAPTSERIAAEVTRVLGREEAARIYEWHEATGRFPPRRQRPDIN